MQLNQLQCEIEGRYDLSTPHRVEDFLFHDPHLAGALSNDPSLGGAPEALLILEGEHGLDVSLFVDGAIIEQLRHDDPAGCLHNGNLAAFWVVLEGVSHFLYLVWRATLGRPITRLEMELQAEVDKFVIAACWLERQHGRVSLVALRRLLFEHVGYRQTLDDDSRQRYWQANRLAARYCEVLARSMQGAAGAAGLSAELRRFYRMGQRQKVRHIEVLSAS